MGFVDGFKRWAKGEDIDDDFDENMGEMTSDNDDFYNPSGTLSTQREKSTNDKIVNIHATTQLSVVLVKPEKFESAAEIADHLKDKHTVLLNLENTNKDVARRLVDFLSGVAYANEGKIKKIANSTYIITPFNVDLLGDLIDELETSGLYL